MTDMIALACPHCGCTSGYFDSTEDKPAWVCSCCGARGPSDYETTAWSADIDAIGAWNRRADGTGQLRRYLEHERERFRMIETKLVQTERRERDLTRENARLREELKQARKAA